MLAEKNYAASVTTQNAFQLNRIQELEPRRN